ncbi:MAG TPA: condensation domain-containing protein, partial [Thermoanaerobaculia bacterium]|nr:condensation domain-containing protein [Thermoanaerobaculia bacterium]
LPAAAEVTLVNSVPSAMAEVVRGGLPPGVRTVNLAGEALPRPLVDQIFAQPAVRRLLNLYGPSEDTTYSTLAIMRRQDALPPSIGRPVADTRAYVVDAGLRPLPVGVPGELALASRSLARGYLGRPDLTAEKFVPDPLAGLSGERIYRTGDLARWRPNGELEFLGRADQQVKVRGYRIELGEIEAALRDVPGVEEVAVAVFATAAGDHRLAGFYVAAPDGPAAGELLARLRERLPAYMVPASLAPLAALPRTANGKIDRKALPQPEWGFASGGAAEAPRTPLEQMLAAIWCDVLGVEQVGREDRFFDRGGHSLLATQVVSRVRGDLGIELPVRAVFETRDLAALAARIAAELALAESGQPEVAIPPLVPQPRPEIVPLSFAQQRLWLADQLTPGSAAYNIPYAVRADGCLDVPALARAFEELARRHEPLRTTFADAGGEPAQRISPPAPVPLPVVDLRSLGEPRAVAEELAAAEARRPFDLARGPLLRVCLLRLAAEEHLLLVTLHHIVSDGWSLGVLMGDIAALYEAFVQGRPSPLADLPVQYADFALWQRRWLAGEAVERQLAFWRARLAGAPALDLPADLPRTGAARRGAARPVVLAPALAVAAQAQSRSLGATPFMVLLTAFAALLSRLSGREDLSVAVPVAGRRWVETEPLIGFFVNTLVLRADLSGEPSFREAAGRIRRLVLEADAHQDLSFERLVEELQPARSLGLPPLAQAMFAFQHLPRTALSLPNLTLQGREVETEASKFDLSLSLVASQTGIAGRLAYDAGLFLPA